MSSSQAEIEEGARARSRIAADPAFAALDASGAPIVAVSGDPLQIIFHNDAAEAVFGADRAALATLLFGGEDASAKRLAALVESVRQGAALRLERLRLDLVDGAQNVTILCRKLEEPAAPDFFVIAALGLRALPRDAAPALAAQELPRDPPSAEALSDRLIRRSGARAPRFLWKTDAEGRFIDVTHVLADVAGEEGSDIIGRTVEEVVFSFGLDPAFAVAIAARKSFAGVEADWPLAEDCARAPTMLGGLPVTDADRRFAGFQGYGVMRLDRAFLAAPFTEARPSESPAPAHSAPEPENYLGDNVVPLRPLQRETAEAPPEPEQAALTAAEQENFEEIARALRARGALDPAPEFEEVEPPPPPTPEPEEKDAPLTDAAVEELAAELGALLQGAVDPDPEPALAPASPPPAAAGVLDCLPVGVLIARGAGTLFANRTLLDYLGYRDIAAFEADGGLARMFFGRPPGDAGARAAAVQSVDGEALDVDVHLQTVDWEGEPATLVTLRRNRARLPGPEESALALARERDEKLARARADNSLLRAIVETSGVAVAIVDDDGRVESATGAFAALFDAERGAFDGLPLGSLFTAEDARLLTARLGRTADAGPLRLTARVGAKRFSAMLRRLGPGQRLCVELRAEEADARNLELAAARDAAEQANAAKSDFLARVSHEIRTPMNAILGFSELMMEERLGPIGNERYKDYLKDVHSSGQLVLSLVNDLLDLSKIEAGKMELDFDRVDANAVISECASLMQTQANKSRIVMRLSLTPGLPPVRADQRSLKQILLNLLSNAMKFNVPGGQVIVSSALTESGHVAIRVKDTGIGMSDDEIATALEPFKQVAVSHKKLGTGLGLPLTKALIEANQASFTIRSRKNEGTLVEIVFPPPQVMAAE
ncbi:two-component system, cell cycle sensor histidine kinase PleC [freshwater sediment metagenome]|uniref:histidine kinase n=1 Tax=freshwater sediment metagenome TaxID=556182 RepID=A0AA48M5I8_9ZZZZ